MKGLGTIINDLAILAGGILGIGLKRFLKEHYQETIMKAAGFAVLFLGAAGALSKMLVVSDTGTTLTTTGTMLMILSLAVGALIGEIIDIDGLFERFGEWLKHRTGSDGDSQFTNGFVSASLTASFFKRVMLRLRKVTSPLIPFSAIEPWLSKRPAYSFVR